MPRSRKPDPVEDMPTAPSRPPASPPAFLSQNMSEEDEYEDHDPQDWMLESHSRYSQDYEEDYGAEYLDELRQLSEAARGEEFDMEGAEIGEGVEITWHQRPTAMKILHSSQKRTQKKKKRVMHAVEVLDSIPESQSMASGDERHHGSSFEAPAGLKGRSVMDHLAEFDQAFEEALEEHRELEGDAIPEFQDGHTRRGTCRLCRGNLCLFRYQISSVPLTPNPAYDWSTDDDDQSDFHSKGKGKGKARLVEEEDQGSQSKDKGKARLVEEDDQVVQSKGKGKARIEEDDDDLEQDDELKFLLDQAKQLYDTEVAVNSASNSSKTSKSAGKQKATQTTAKRGSRSRRAGKR